MAAVALMAFGCGSPPPAETAPPKPPGSPPPQIDPRRIETIAPPDRPVLQLIHREGNPRGAVAVAVFPGAGSNASLALAGLVEGRMQADGFAVTVRPHGPGFLLVARPRNVERAAEFLKSVRKALATPATARELPWSRSFVHAVETREPPISPIGQCSAEVGADERLESEKLTLERLEEYRTLAFASSRIAFAVVGSKKLLAAVRAADASEWPSQEPIDESWPESDSTTTSTNADRPQLSLAFRVPEGSQALGAGHVLTSPRGDLEQRLQALGGDWIVEHATVTLRPRGACVRVDLRPEDENGHPKADEVARVALASSQTIERLLENPTSSDVERRALLAPTDPAEAAALAAWTAVPSASGPGPLRRSVEYRAPRGSKGFSGSALEKTMTAMRSAWEERVLPQATAIETGQPETWMLVASPCGTVAESLDEAGTRALAVRALARSFDGHRGVSLESWATPRGVGLLGHASELPGETPTARARRIALTLGEALAGPPVDGRDVAGARAETLERLGDDAGWWLAVETLSSRRVSAIQPWGAWKAVSQISTSDVERARAALAKGPLKIALLADTDAAQAEVAGATLSDWLAPLRDEDAPCPESSFTPPKPGLWTLETIDDSVRTGAYVSAHLGVPREIGQATAFLLNRSGGYLDQALRQANLVATARAHYLGGRGSGGLLIELGAQPEALDAAIHQTRALLDRLAKGALTSTEAELAIQEQVRKITQTEADPRGRIVELWHGEKPTLVTAESLRKAHEGLVADKHLVVVVRRRK